MKRLTLSLFFGGLFLSQALADSNWKSVERILGRSGIEQGDLFKVTYLRTDLNVTVQGVPIEPGFALTSWFVFKPLSKTNQLSGEMALLDEEVPKALSLLTRNGFQVTALGDRLLNESPHISYVRIIGKGARVNLARALKVLLSAIPLAEDSGGQVGGAAKPKDSSARSAGTHTLIPPPDPSTGSTSSLQASAGEGWTKIKAILGTGQVDGKILRYGFPRAEAGTEKGLEIHPFMEMESSIRFQKVEGLTIGKRRLFGLKIASKPSKDIVAAVGDFVLTADEVNLVVESFKLHRIAITAIDNPVPEESPQLFFLHFWTLGPTEEVAAGLKAALEKAHLR